MFTQSVQWLKLADMEQIGGPLDLLQNFVGAELTTWGGVNGGGPFQIHISLQCWLKEPFVLV